MSSPVLYVICCAAPPAKHVGDLVRQAQDRGWDTCVIATPSAVRFLDVQAIEELTGHPVRSTYKEPGAPDVLPPADAMVVAPATVNTVNKWGAGICDTLALGLIVEAIGMKLPVVVMPYSNRYHMAHPAFTENIERLRSWGVVAFFGKDGSEPHLPNAGTPADFPWHLTLDALNDVMR